MQKICVGLRTSFLGSLLFATGAQAAANCNINFTVVDPHVQKALLEPKAPHFPARDAICERLKSIDGAINVRGGFAVGSNSASYYVDFTVADRVTGLSIPDYGVDIVRSGRFPSAQTDSELLLIASEDFRRSAERLLQNWYESNRFQKAIDAFLKSKAQIRRR